MRPGGDVLRLLLLLAVIAWAAQRAARLELDVENRSMRSTGAEQQDAERVRERHFGYAATLVLLLEPASDSATPDVDALDRWTRRVSDRPEVEGAFPLGAEPGERLLALNLKPDAAGHTADALARVVEEARAASPPDMQLFVSGPPAGEAAIASALDREQRRIIPLVGALLFLLLLAVYRSPSLALGTLLPAVGAIALTGALQHACGVPINPVTSLLPPVLLAVGVASCVHLLDAYLGARAAGQDPDDSSRTALRTIFAPAIGCAATTLFGFVALTASPIPAIRRFGLLAAAGVVFTFLLSFALLPIWLRLFARSPSLIRRAVDRGRWTHVVSSLVRRLEPRANRITIGAGLAAAILVWAWTRLEVDTDPLRILPAHHPFRIATAEIGARLGGTDTFDLVLEPPAPAGGMLGLVALQARLKAQDGIAGAAGVPRLSNDGTALIPLLLEPAGTTARERTFTLAEELAREAGWSSAQACGSAVSVARDSGAIARGEIYGILASLAALVPCIWIGLRSLRLTLLGLAANLLPCLSLHGGLALAGRPLSVGSAMIGSVILGIVVDDAIYFLHVYRSRVASSSPSQAVDASLRSSGRAMTVTSLVLALGFLAGALGELSTTREFAFLAAATILAAWAANLLLLPAFLLARGPVRAPRGAA